VKLFPALHTTSDELLHLDALRFVASAGIVLHHSLEFWYPPELRATIANRTSGLALFVDLFFVISGFVIAHVYSDRIANIAGYGQFLKRRVARLVPLHWLTLACAIALWSLVRLAGVQAGGMPAFDLACIARSAMLVHAYVGCPSGSYFNPVSWSISVEMALYVLFPITILVGRLTRLANLALGVAILATALAIATATPKPLDWEMVPPLVRGLASFLIGVGLFDLRERIRLPLARIWTVLSCCALIAAMLIGASHAITLALTYLCVLCAIAAERASAWPVVKRLAVLGQLTYSIYMWHGLVILVLLNAVGDKLLHLSGLSALLLAMGCYGLILMMGYVSLVWIETPARRWIDRVGKAGRPRRTAGTNS
jgi:peptidoglycan/LPS O-acetylase OafA/YrhL